MSQTVIYEITAIVAPELVQAYEKYMRERHIPELLATKYFRAAYFARTLENHYRIQYHAPGEDVLRDYLKNEAERLRADFKAHFPAGIELSREVWIVLHAWEKELSEK
jgi:hypothetical protein